MSKTHDQEKPDGFDTVRKLGSAEMLTEKVHLPSDIFLAVSNGRAEPLRLWVPRPLETAEAGMVVDTLRVLIETNEALRDHCREIENQAKQIQVGLEGINRSMQRLHDLAGFRQPIEDGS